ncbi:MAG TPA: AMP-binding protein [Methylomirabilota bacterium]|nr:AMP-binding protein [Methylomirabilota bacterium]
MGSDSVAALIAEVARRRPDHPALRWNRGALTYRELTTAAGDFARNVTAHRMRPGQRLALSIPNRPEFVVSLLGGLAAGATVAPLDVLLKPEERAEILADLQPALLVEAGSEGKLVEHELSGVAGDAAAPALVLYTSGSTGRPKGSLLSHAALEFANRSWAGPVMGLCEDDVVLAALPLAHSFGLNGTLLAPLLAGATVVLVERFAADTVAETLERDGVTVLPAVATMFRRLLDLPGFTGAPRLRLGVSGAAPCPWDVAEAWRERTGTRIVRGYGTTELFRPLSYLADHPTDYPDCVGRPVPGVEVRVVDDAGASVRGGEVGELLIRTPAVMDGYLGSPDETRAVLRDGWFHTGDLARLTHDGYVAIAGRKRERILRGGYSIFPAEVEAVLAAHPAIAEAAVVAVPHAELGEEIAAFVALRPAAIAGTDELIAWCRDRLAAFKYPRQVTILPSLPKSPTGKVLKGQLRGL